MPTLLAVNRNIAVFGHLKWSGVIVNIYPEILIRGRLLKVKCRPDRKLTSERLLHYEGNLR